MTQRDSIHGVFPAHVRCDQQQLFIDHHRIAVRHIVDPMPWNWACHDIDLVLECSGCFAEQTVAQCVLNTRLKRLLCSYPIDKNIGKTVIYGIKHVQWSKHDGRVSNGSCTTNGLISVLTLLNNELGVESGMTTTVHSMMNDQSVLDTYAAKDVRLMRCAAHTVVPVDTMLAKDIEPFFPHVSGRFSSIALRVPTMYVSLIDLVVQLSTTVTHRCIDDFFQRITHHPSWSPIVGYVNTPCTSVDFKHDTRSVVIEGTQTCINEGRLLKLVCWFDNERAFSHRMLDTAVAWMQYFKT